LAVLDLIGDAYDVPKAADESDKRPERAASLVIFRSKPRQIAQFSTIARLQESMVAASQMRADRETGKLAAAQIEIESLKAKLSSETETAARLANRVAQLEHQNDDLEKRLNGAIEAAAHRLEDLRSRYRKLLSEDLKRLASRAVDGLEIDPPKPEFSKAFLSQILQKLDDEISWLSEHSA